MEDKFAKFVGFCLLLLGTFIIGIALGSSVKECGYQSMLVKEKHAAYKEETGEWYLKTWPEK